MMKDVIHQQEVKVDCVNVLGLIYKHSTFWVILDTGDIVSQNQIKTNMPLPELNVDILKFNNKFLILELTLIFEV